mmetsp:Transcript_53381/g.124254  ORF Transcript_53381/g.124254 Transcript_53381/m.124254 type:complete len:294 (-) Transcript_53381:512-1393(-)
MWSRKCHLRSCFGRPSTWAHHPSEPPFGTRLVAVQTPLASTQRRLRHSSRRRHQGQRGRICCTQVAGTLRLSGRALSDGGCLKSRGGGKSGSCSRCFLNGGHCCVRWSPWTMRRCHPKRWNSCSLTCPRRRRRTSCRRPMTGRQRGMSQRPSCLPCWQCRSTSCASALGLFSTPLRASWNGWPWRRLRSAVLASLCRVPRAWRGFSALSCKWATTLMAAHHAGAQTASSLTHSRSWASSRPCNRARSWISSWRKWSVRARACCRGSLRQAWNSSTCTVLAATTWPRRARSCGR